MLAKTDKKIVRVAIFGDATARENDEHFREAYEVAKLLAENGYIVVNGGGPGVMLAASRGAKDGGGRVEVVTLNPKMEPENYEGDNESNIGLADEVYQTETVGERTNKLIEIADAFVIFKGGTGTLAEIGTTWELAKFDYGHHEPLIFFGKFWEKIVDDLIKGLNLEKKEQGVVEVVKRAEEVVRVLKESKAEN